MIVVVPFRMMTWMADNGADPEVPCFAKLKACDVIGQCRSDNANKEARLKVKDLLRLPRQGPLIHISMWWSEWNRCFAVRNTSDDVGGHVSLTHSSSAQTSLSSYCGDQSSS